MTYSLVLTIEKSQEKEVLKEIKDYISDKNGKILKEDPLGEKSLKRGENASFFRLEIEFPEKETEKLKKHLSGKKTVISHLLTKIDLKKRERAEIKKKKSIKTKKRKKEEAPKADKILSSIEEEKERIKDLDSELDKILNE